MFNLAGYLDERARLVNEALEGLLPPESESPAELHRAMRYSVFAGGKRLRPVVCMAASESCGGGGDLAKLAGAAIECLHTYTLIHDDLPAMDDDALRRGRPTAHMVFGEANAILAGDALLTFAFELMARCPAPPPYPPGQIAFELACAAGSRGVVGGQSEDLAAEGQPADAQRLRRIHLRKTAALFRAACRMGAILAAADERRLGALGIYGEQVGLAFQIADDILDATSSPAELGKATGRDAANAKLTYVRVYGVEEARRQACAHAAEAEAALSGLDDRSDPLRALARFIVERDR